MSRLLVAVILGFALVPRLSSGLSAGPNYSSNEASCNFLSCGNADGPANNGCNYSSGAAQAIVVNGFNFNLPSSATSIDGITVEVKAGRDTCTGSAQLLKNGSLVGSTKSLGASPVTMSCASTAFVTLGSASDTWGSTWTYSDLNNSQFGVRLTNGANCTAVGIDAVRVTVAFSIATAVCGDGFVTGSEACDDGGTARGDGCSAKCQVEGALDEAAQKCVVKLNADLSAIDRAYRRVQGRCFTAVKKGKEPSFDDCVTAGTTALAKPTTKTQNDAAKFCGVTPAFGFATPTTTLIMGALLADQSLDTVFGDPPHIALSTDAAGAKCQANLRSRIRSLVALRKSLFQTCKKKGVKGTTTVQQMLSGADLETCLTALPDPRDRIAKSVAKGGIALTNKCVGQTLSTLFPGQCSGSATPADLVTCANREVACAHCIAINEADNISADCDLVDDGLSNGSCN